MRRGLTLIETLAVVAIVAALASLLFPLLAQAKERAWQTSCLSALHQSHVAIKLYQADYDGRDVGSVSQMGLSPYPVTRALPALRALALCRRVPSERIPNPKTYPYIYQPNDGPTGREAVSSWSRYVASKGDAAILLIDVNHNLPSEPLASRFYEHTGLAVTYGGAALHRVRPGDPSDLWWWDPTKENEP